MWLVYKSNKRTRLRRCKKKNSWASWQIYFLYKARPKNHPEKMQKKRSGVPPERVGISISFIIWMWGELSAHFCDVAKKAAPERVGTSISYTKRIQNTYQKRCIYFWTGSRREFTPGHLGAQNQWLLKGFLSEGSLHQTRGRDRPGAHFATC